MIHTTSLNGSRKNISLSFVPYTSGKIAHVLCCPGLSQRLNLIAESSKIHHFIRFPTPSKQTNKLWTWQEFLSSFRREKFWAHWLREGATYAISWDQLKPESHLHQFFGTLEFLEGICKQSLQNTYFSSLTNWPNFRYKRKDLDKAQS